MGKLPPIEQAVDDMLDSLAKRLASSLRKGDVLHPKIKQSIIRMGQKYYVKPVREQKAMQTALGFIIRYTLLGALSISTVYLLASDPVHHSEYRRQCRLKERVEQYEHEVSQQLKENERQINQPSQGFQIFKQAVMGDNASKVVDGAEAKPITNDKP